MADEFLDDVRHVFRAQIGAGRGGKGQVGMRRGPAVVERAWRRWAGRVRCVGITKIDVSLRRARAPKRERFLMEMFGVFCVAVGNSGWQLVDSMVQAAQEAVQKCLVSRELVGADPNLRIGMLALHNQPQVDELRQHAVRRRAVDLQLGRNCGLRRPGQPGAVCMDRQDR